MKNILKKFHKNMIKKIIMCIVLLFLVYFIFTLISINYYLNKYGYSVRELPKTVAVYFHLSKGFTVEQTEDGKYIFIGRHDDIYEEILKKEKFEADRYGASVLYTKYEDGKQIRLSIVGTNYWCHWFRIYRLEGTKI